MSDVAARRHPTAPLGGCYPVADLRAGVEATDARQSDPSEHTTIRVGDDRSGDHPARLRFPLDEVEERLGIFESVGVGNDGNPERDLGIVERRDQLTGIVLAPRSQGHDAVVERRETERRHVRLQRDERVGSEQHLELGSQPVG